MFFSINEEHLIGKSAHRALHEENEENKKDKENKEKRKWGKYSQFASL